MNKASASQDYEAFKTALDKFEKSFGIGLYYDGTSNLQATLGFEPMNEAGFNAIPVIRFLDGTTVGVEEYFSEQNFGSVMQRIAEWGNGIAGYLGLMDKEPVK